MQFSQSFLYFFIVLTSCAIIYSSISQHYTQIFTFVFFYLCHCIKAPRRTKSFSELKILYNTVTPLLLFMGRNFLNWKFRMIPLWPRILPIRNAKHRQNPVTVRGHRVPVYCNWKIMKDQRTRIVRGHRVPVYCNTPLHLYIKI